MSYSTIASSPLRVLVMAGGTGGHVFPALAVAGALQDKGIRVTWMGTRRGLEAEVIPQAGYPVAWITIGGLRGKGLGNWFLAPWRFLRAELQALIAVARLWPHGVLGMGGFVTGPGGIAAWLLRRPLVIHEQNAVAGLTNRWLARVAHTVLEGFPGTFPPRVGAVHTGNPVRPEIAGMPGPEQRFPGRTGPGRLLVLGGSLGAQALNRAVPQALAQMPADQRPEVWHQVGQRNLEETQDLYQRAGVAGRLHPFIKDMAQAYGWADLVLCRAGALTIAELTAAGVGSMLVPYPHAVDDHQSRNARFLVEGGAALLVPQPQLTAVRLAELLAELFGERQKLWAMAVRARGLARPCATAQVAAAMLAALDASRGREAPCA